MTRRGASEQYALSEDQVNALLNVPVSAEDKLLLKIMIYLGLRAGEVAHLNATWLQEGDIRVPAFQACDHPECKGEWRPKTKRSIRTLPIPGHLSNELQKFLNSHPQGFGLTRQAVWQKVKRICKLANIRVKGLSGDTIYPHVLRATCATILASHGMSAPGLCYYMGWSSLAIGEHYISIAQAKKTAHEQARAIFG